MAFQVVKMGEEMSILWVIHWQKKQPGGRPGRFFREIGTGLIKK
jgi:hypothetical protein